MNRFLALSLYERIARIQAETASLLAQIAPWCEPPRTSPAAPAGDGAAPPASQAAVAGPPSATAVRVTAPPAPAERRADGATKREHFRELWLAGKSNEEITAALGWKKTTIYSEAYRLHLGRRGVVRAEPAAPEKIEQPPPELRKRTDPMPAPTRGIVGSVTRETIATPTDSKALIEKFIASGRVTQCPTAVSAPPAHGVTVSAETRAAHEKLAAEREAERVANLKPHHRKRPGNWK